MGAGDGFGEPVQASSAGGRSWSSVLSAGRWQRLVIKARLSMILRWLGEVGMVATSGEETGRQGWLLPK